MGCIGMQWGPIKKAAVCQSTMAASLRADALRRESGGYSLTFEGVGLTL